MAIEKEYRKLKIYTQTPEDKKRTLSLTPDPVSSETNMLKVVNAVKAVTSESFISAGYEDLFEMTEIK